MFVLKTTQHVSKREEHIATIRKHAMIPSWAAGGSSCDHCGETLSEDTDEPVYVVSLENTVLRYLHIECGHKAVTQQPDPKPECHKNPPCCKEAGVAWQARSNYCDCDCHR